MSAIDPDAPVYPQRKAIGSDGVFVDEAKGGITVRAYFAAMAMQGLVHSLPTISHGPASLIGEFREMADVSVMCADALIAALNEVQK